MINIDQAVRWLSQGDSISWTNGQFQKCGTLEKFKRFCIPGREKEEIKKVTDVVRRQLEGTSTDRQALLELGNLLITRYHNCSRGKAIMQTFERFVVGLQPAASFICSDNRISYEKWLKSGMPGFIYYKYPEFCTFIEDSYLLSQIKITKDTFFVLDDEPAILVSGMPTKWSEFKQSFEIQYSKLYRELFIVHKQSRQVYTYLDNGRGLQPHHPYLTGLAPISKLDASELAAVTGKAAQFIRPGEEDLSPEERSQLNAARPHIVQLVTSYMKSGDSHFSELINNPKHPYLRIISGMDVPQMGVCKGDVFEVGYGWKEKVSIPFETIQGQFRSPDFWEYKSCDERVVTSIPISRKEAIDLYEFTLRYHKDGIQLGKPIAFHLFRQNCSTYARTALQVAGIKVPTEMTLPDVVKTVAPEWMRKIGQGLNSAKDCVKLGLKKISKVLLPVHLKKGLHMTASKISALFQSTLVSLTALGLLPIGIALGGAMGGGGRAFVPTGEPDETIKPPLKNWKNWFNLSGYTINLPGILQRWQRAQASTELYKNPLKLAIVPQNV